VLAFVRKHQHGQIVRQVLYLHCLLLMMEASDRKSDLRCAGCGKMEAAPLVCETTGLLLDLTSLTGGRYQRLTGFAFLLMYLTPYEVQKWSKSLAYSDVRLG
jgi:hypothetical protein